MNATRDPTARLRAGLNPLLTSSLGMGNFHNPVTTPISAVSMTSHNAFSSAQTPISAIQPYNPQEWIVSPSERTHQSLADSQSSPPPPPPYSPPRSQRPISMSFDSPPANTSALRAPPSNVQRRSPEPANPSFPPPPPASGRGGSRERRFGLPSLGRRRDHEPATTPPDPHPIVPSHPPAITSRPHAAPLTIQIPQPQRPSPELSHGVPPATRRAASTGAIATPTSARSRSSSQVRWEPGMPLPPPPPGPPPSSNRSQSSQRSSGSDPIVSPPTRRAPPSGVTTLGPVPPTPADWIDNDTNQRGRSPPRDNAAETSSITSSNPGPDSAITSGSMSASASATASASTSTSASASGASPAGGLTRARAMRGEKTLRERRNESRTRGVRDSIDASINAEPLSDIVIPSSSSGLTRRLTITKSTPRSGRSNNDGTPRTGEAVLVLEPADSRNSTPRAPGSAQIQPDSSPTPPFSPRPLKTHPDTPTFAPKALPTPPPQSRSSSSQNKFGPEGFGAAASSPSRPVSKQLVLSQTPDQFSRATVERFQVFAQKESAAPNDAERVRLFAEFIVSESRIRRERYSAAIGAMGSEIFDLTRDLFRPMVTRRESTTSQGSEFTPLSSSETTRSHRGSAGSTFTAPGPSSSAPTSAGVPMSPTGPPPGGNPNYTSNNFMPSLSPILSMSISDVLDEDDSRGRPASRWWEADSTGNTSNRIERSKRESKYMGVPKEAREALQWIDEPGSAGPSNKRDSSNEYPQEKTGWHDRDQNSTPQPPPLRNSLLLSLSSPNTPNLGSLDISRLVTLPPPYPRHHPAVNNNHPDLTDIRTAVRATSDMTEIDATKERFEKDSEKMRLDASEAATKRKQSLRMNLQQEISAGNMTYAEAAAIEADAAENENVKLKELDKRDFDSFQTAVVMPLNELLTSRIAKATALFDNLRSQLFTDTRQPSPNMPQEGGDEQPELLEKLTLLKWIFEARETLHRAIYDLLSDRNDRYRNMIITPYRLANNTEKLAGATAFFADDAAKRAHAFAEEVLRRTREFRDVVEENVSRGVELQLSAFWDIAPPLKRLLDKIPAELAGFTIQIPASEFDESPSYVDHPLQYLFSLLLHAEKSTYQFIESQTNLLCLLHEVKEAVTTARAKVMETDDHSDERAVGEMRRGEDARLTGDLKEKVRVVQDQWNSALGDCIVGVKERVGEWLLETGGWDESLEDSGVGGPVV